MSQTEQQVIQEVCRQHGNDRTRLMDIIRDVQTKLGYVGDGALDAVAKAVGAHRVDVESCASFYAFFNRRPKGQVVIRLCNDVVDRLKGADRVAQAFEQTLGIQFGQTTPDGQITLEYAPCIGMCDQAPAALINDVVVTHLSTDAARELVNRLRQDPDPTKLVEDLGDGNNAHELIHSMVHNNLRKPGVVIFDGAEPNAGLRKALSMSPVEVIREVKAARLRGRGGAGFPTGMKWEFTRGATGEQKCIICNADEGEPGTFKDRVVLTERAELVFEGMTIGGYAIGADLGIVYLRGEYAYLRQYLQAVLAERRTKGLLGQNAGGKAGFNFDIRIQIGAGAYVCGEETSLISSCEGLRGDPKTRPPFPAQRGYLGRPTSVNNVETFCCVARIMDKGAGWFAELGSPASTGTKLLSISGDCRRPGVYEFTFGVKLSEVLKQVGAEDAIAVQVGGASGTLVGPADYGRAICYDDLATGGAIMVFGPSRDVVEIAHQYLEFFVEESCGYCTPCRVGNVLLKERLGQILAGHGEPADLAYLQQLGETVKTMSRCGLGQTSPNPVLWTLKNFRAAYERRLKPPVNGRQPAFDLAAAVRSAETIIGRKSVHAH
jgi:[NiFe] hydrogenase diaphorase moiety large subunit